MTPLTERFGRIYIGERPNGAIKIGLARYPEARAHQLGLKLLGWWEGSWQEEQAVHKKLSASRIHGREWYADTPEIAAYVMKTIGVMITTGRILNGEQIVGMRRPTSIWLTEKDREIIQQAADHIGTPLTAFIRHAAKKRASEVLKGARRVRRAA